MYGMPEDFFEDEIVINMGMIYNVAMQYFYGSSNGGKGEPQQGWQWNRPLEKPYVFQQKFQFHEG